MWIDTSVVDSTSGFYVNPTTFVIHYVSTLDFLRTIEFIANVEKIDRLGL